jgi:hypothetical protein
VAATAAAAAAEHTASSSASTRVACGSCNTGWPSC